MTEKERYTLKEIDNFDYGLQVTDMILDKGIELPQSTVCDLLNNQNERIKELEKEKEFWKHNCISESNRNSILICELGFAQEQGYEWSDAFEKYENYVKENSEWNKRYLSEKGNGDDVND